MLGDPLMISRFVCAVNMITPQLPCNLRLNDRAHRKTGRRALLRGIDNRTTS